PTPLAEEPELPRLVLAYPRGHLPAGARQGAGLAATQLGLPVGPGGAAVRLLEGHEQGVVGEPARLGLAERPQLGALRGGGALLEAPGGALQQRELGGDQGAVVDALPRQRRQGRQLPRLQPPLGDELLDGDQVVVAGERAERLVGAVAVAGWAQGHHLPQALPGLLEEVEPGDRLAAQLADAVRPRQRGGVEQDARAPGERHGY